MTPYQATPDYYRDVIQHYGVKGMKWHKSKKKRKIADGVNKDGTTRYRDANWIDDGAHAISVSMKNRSVGKKLKRKLVTVKANQNNTNRKSALNRKYNKTEASK